MEGNSPYVTNMVNSIIGVSVLAMPFCFKQCGIILGLCLLLAAAWLTFISCSMLSTAAFHKRRRTYEYLALYTLGPTGKFAVELSMIGMNLGTCIAFYVVIGDLSNGTLSKLFVNADLSLVIDVQCNIAGYAEDPHLLRVFTIVFCGLCIALPLGLMKSLAVLSYFGYFSLIFYLVFVVVVILNAVSNGLLNWMWWDDVILWRPAGIFQCLPIFSLAFACQCQLFIVYDSLEEPSIRRIESIVSHAIKFVSVVYMTVGFFGYTTYNKNIAGNVLVSFPSNLLLDFIKLGFALSVVLGFPLIIFPCRQSIYTLFFSKPSGEGLPTNTYIPPFLFKSITLVIVLSTMIIAIVIPNVETILGLTGATMGSIICFIFPALIFDKAMPKVSGGLTKLVFAVGCVLLVVCTYSNLTTTKNGVDVPPIENPIILADVNPPVLNPNIPKVDLGEIKNENKVIIDPIKEPDKPNVEEKPKAVAEVHDDEHRHEPANPVDPENLALNKDSNEGNVASEIDKKKDLVENKGKDIESDKKDILVPKENLPADKAPPVKEPLPIDKAREQEKGVEEVKKVDAEIKNIAGAEVVAMPVKSDPGNEGADTKSEIKSNADSNPEAKNSEIQDKTSDNQQDNVEVLHKKELLNNIKEQLDLLKQQKDILEEIGDVHDIKDGVKAEENKADDEQLKESDGKNVIDSVDHRDRKLLNQDNQELEEGNADQGDVQKDGNADKKYNLGKEENPGPGRELLMHKEEKVIIGKEPGNIDTGTIEEMKKISKQEPEIIDHPVDFDSNKVISSEITNKNNGTETENTELHKKELDADRKKRFADTDELYEEMKEDGIKLMEKDAENERQLTGNEEENINHGTVAINPEIIECAEDDTDCRRGKRLLRDLKSFIMAESKDNNKKR